MAQPDFSPVHFDTPVQAAAVQAAVFCHLALIPQVAPHVSAPGDAHLAKIFTQTRVSIDVTEIMATV